MHWLPIIKRITIFKVKNKPHFKKNYSISTYDLYLIPWHQDYSGLFRISWRLQSLKVRLRWKWPAFTVDEAFLTINMVSSPPTWLSSRSECRQCQPGLDEWTVTKITFRKIQEEPVFTGPGVLDKSMLGVIWTIAIVYGCLSPQILSQAQCNQHLKISRSIQLIFRKIREIIWGKSISLN